MGARPKNRRRQTNLFLCAAAHASWMVQIFLHNSVAILTSIVGKKLIIDSPRITGDYSHLCAEFDRMSLKINLGFVFQWKSIQAKRTARYLWLLVKVLTKQEIVTIRTWMSCSYKLLCSQFLPRTRCIDKQALLNLHTIPFEIKPPHSFVNPKRKKTTKNLGAPIFLLRFSPAIAKPGARLLRESRAIAGEVGVKRLTLKYFFFI